MNSETLSGRGLFLARAVIGLIQGLALYLIYLAFDERIWPATSGLTFAPILLVSLFMPLLALQALGNMRLRTLAVWCGAATLIVAALGFYDIWHGWPDVPTANNPASGIVPSAQLFFAIAATLFISHSLIEGGDIDRKFIADYPTHFDVAWKLGVQGALALAFTGAFWGLLWLGAGLFHLIKIEAIRQLIEHRWFAIPATTLAVAVAIHVSDVRAGIVRGIRTLGLTLLSWLLPLMALIATGFLATLIFTGLQPLWDTQFATALLLAAFAALLVLINAAYEDGSTERRVPRVLRYPGLIAALDLIPLTALAGYALYLRVDQYGWTAERIYAAAAVTVAACYAVGYAIAAAWRGEWLKRIERWNFYTSLVVLAVLLALFSPIADPYRISVASQMARLESGKIAPERFDFINLRFAGGRFGYAALEGLKTTQTGDRAQFVRETAERAMLATNRFQRLLNPEINATNVVVHPVDAKLPPTFLAQPPVGSVVFQPQPGCLLGQRSAICDAWMKDLDGDGKDEIIVLERNAVWAYRLNAEARWQVIGNWMLPNGCSSILSEMQAGNFSTPRPEPGPWPDLEVSGQKFRLSEATPPPCPK